jgi:hypothetical protein
MDSLLEIDIHERWEERAKNDGLVDDMEIKELNRQDNGNKSKLFIDDLIEEELKSLENEGKAIRLMLTTVLLICLQGAL